jgi:hypothetical protein
MSFVFPITLTGDTPTIRVLDADGNVLDDSLGSATFLSFGTLPQNFSSSINVYIQNYGTFPVYAVQIEGVASSKQLGLPVNTYEALNLPQEVYALDGMETAELQLTWTVPEGCPLGMKIWAIQVTDIVPDQLLEDHDYFAEISITNNETDYLEDYPIPISFISTSIDWSKTSSDGRDLRFYDDTFQELQFYIESWSTLTETGTVYVRLPKAPYNTEIKIICGYGKWTLASASDVHGKYDLHETFSDGTFDESWIDNGTMLYTLEDGYLSMTQSASNNYQYPPGLYIELPYPADRRITIIFKAGKKDTQTGVNNSMAIGTGIYLCDSLTRSYNLFTLAQSTKEGILPLGYYCWYRDGAGTNYISNYIGGYSSAAITDATPYEWIITCYGSGYTSETRDGSPLGTGYINGIPRYLCIHNYNSSTWLSYTNYIYYLKVFRRLDIAPTVVFTSIPDITAYVTNPDVDSGKIACIGNVVKQLVFHDYDFKKIIYEVGNRNAYWKPPGSEGIYVWGKLEMRPLYGEDVSFVDNLYANDAYFYTFTDYTYDVHDKLIVEGVIYDIQAIQVHDAGRETIYKTLVLKRQPEYYACCVGIVS